MESIVHNASERSSRHEVRLCETKLLKNIKNSEIAISKEKRSFLTYPVRGLVKCDLEEKEDSINFIFDSEGLEMAELVLKKSKVEKLRFLINCGDLEHLSNEYQFSLSIENLLIDINLVPQLLLRDVKTSTELPFVTKYLALIGSVLGKYKYEDYLNGGQDLYKKKKFLSELSKLEEAKTLQDYLLTEYYKVFHEIQEMKKLVSRKSVLITKIIIPILSALLLTALFFGGRMMLIDIPFRDSVILASTAYMHGDHLAVQAALRSYSIDQLSDETKFFLSRSYVSTEALSHTQVGNILVGLARLTDPIIFDYWILLGRLYFTEAVDIAQRLGDDELLLFAYLKYEVFVRNDINMPGEERMALLNYLETNIERLNRERDEAAASLITVPQTEED